LLKRLYVGRCDPRLLIVVAAEHPELLRGLAEKRCPFCSLTARRRYVLLNHLSSGRCSLVTALVLREVLERYRLANNCIRYAPGYGRYVVRYGEHLGSFATFEEAYRFLRRVAGW
jgi:hypothetical protein